MDKKRLILIITAVILVPLICFWAYFLYSHQRITPGVKGLAKYNVGVFYCSNSDKLPSLVFMIRKRLNAKVYEITSAVPYPKDPEEFKNRIHEENVNPNKVVIDPVKADLKKFDYVIFASPVVEDRPCPSIQKFVLDNRNYFVKKPVSILVLYKKGESPANTVMFFNRRLHESIWKTPFVTEIKNDKQLNYEFDLWFNLMKFERRELR